MTTKNCANGPKLVLKDLRKKSFVRNVQLPQWVNVWEYKATKKYLAAKLLWTPLIPCKLRNFQLNVPGVPISWHVALLVRRL